MNARILIAEDDAAIRLGLIAALESEGHEVVAASDGAQALKLYPQYNFDLVVLDIMMPRLSGYEVCTELRRKNPLIPILFLTAKGEEADKVLGLRLGGDDYVSKPFGLQELLARVAALLRRSRAQQALPQAAVDPLGPVFKLGLAEVDRKRFVLRQADGLEVSLTVRELHLAEAFARCPGEVLSRDQLLNTVWGQDYLGTTRTLDQHVAQLRRKVDSSGANTSVISTIHGVGYRYDPVAAG